MKKIFLLSILIVILSSCTDFLEPKQIDLVYNEVFWKTEKDAETALLGSYALYRGLMIDGNWFNRGDATTGYFRRGWNGGSDQNFYVTGDFSNTSTLRSWGSLESYCDWGNYYKVIANTNLVIQKINNMPLNAFSDNKKNELLGEAYFIRALTYFNILEIWGNAPYISESIESSNQVINGDLSAIVIPRTKDFIIGTNILQDVDTAIELLDYTSQGKKGIRANKAAAEALAGHVNLWMNFLALRDHQPNPEKYITNAITALESLNNNGGFSLQDYSSPDALKALFSEGSSEDIFELNISSQENESYRVDHGGIASFTSKVLSLDGDAKKDRASFINFIPRSQKELIYPDYDFDTNSGDLRTSLFFDSWNSYYDEPFSDVSPTATDRNLVTWLKKYSMMSVDPLHKWNEYAAYFSESNIPIFRYTEVYLLLAEAYVKANRSNEAITIINKIRARANLAPFAGGDVLKEVLQQRTCELIGEGQLFYDMVRNNYYPNPQVMDPDRYKQQGYYWPVSSKILISNKLISQTPYWNGKTSW